MQTNLLWKGREYNSLENCLVNVTEAGVAVNSVIVGGYEGKIYRVEYYIRTNEKWETVFLEIMSQHSNTKEHFVFEGDGNRNWKINENTDSQFNGCTDVDIPLTPFTNSLPINRLKMQNDKGHEIRVIYVDLLIKQITPVRQKYVRLSDTRYHYENIPTDFQADIEVDGLGYVVDYPSLFIRSAAINSHYNK